MATSRARQQKIQEAGDAVVASIQDALRRLQTSHKQTKGNVDRTVANLNGALQGIERLQADIELVAEKFAYVQVMKGYVADLCDCLAEKVRGAPAWKEGSLHAMWAGVQCACCPCLKVYSLALICKLRQAAMSACDLISARGLSLV